MPQSTSSYYSAKGRQTDRHTETETDRLADRITKECNIILDIFMYHKLIKLLLKDVENKCIKVLRFTDGVTRQQSSAYIPI